MYISMLWSVLMSSWEINGRTNDDREKDVVPLTRGPVFFLFGALGRAGGVRKKIHYKKE